MMFGRKSWTWGIIALMMVLVSACVPLPPAAGSTESGTAPESEGKTGEQLTVYVAPEKAKCVGVAPMMCLQVKFSEDGESQLFYGEIDGFVFVPGFEYELRVLRTQVENPPADASSLAYSLIGIMRETATAPDEGAGTVGGPAAIFLPDGQGCQFAGTGATLAFDGKRLNYTCSSMNELPFTGLIGDIIQAEAGMLTVELATIDRDHTGFVLVEAQAITFLAAQVELIDGTQCAHAGFGATLAFDGERLNYTCGDPSVGLLGAFKQGEAGVWAATKVLLQHDNSGFSIAESEKMILSSITGAEIK